jgi:hypothetical protein
VINPTRQNAVGFERLFGLWVWKEVLAEFDVRLNHQKCWFGILEIILLIKPLQHVEVCHEEQPEVVIPS